MYKLMVVEDESLIRRGLIQYYPWSEWGYQIAGEAENGAEALSLFASVTPDAILLDLNMPDMDGLEMLRRLRSKGIQCPVVVITGYAEFEYARQAINYGVSTYLLKPVKRKELKEAFQKVKEILDSQKPAELLAGSIGLEPVIGYIDVHFPSGIRMKELADLAHLSISQLTRSFRAETGMSVGEYIKKKRISTAKDLLIKTDLRIHEIAGRVGIDELSYFGKVFREETGMTPREFRERRK